MHQKTYIPKYVYILMFLIISITATANHTNVAKLKAISQNEEQIAVQKKEKAMKWARENRAPLYFSTPHGAIAELMRVENGQPIYYITENIRAADTISADELWLGGSSMLNLSGANVYLGIWDQAAVYSAHVEFGGRVSQGDGVTGLSDHATHCAGTMIASGVDPYAKGMSPNANLIAFDWNSDTSEMATQAANGLRVSNHSYGIITGWYYNGSSWVWSGNSSISDQEDYKFGFYDSYAAAWDNLAFNAPYYLICKSAGNDRGEGPNGGAYPKDGGATGYDTISSAGVAKNILTVGAVGSIIGGFRPGSVVMSSFSSWGPADDGRVKPDVVADGVGVYSTLAGAGRYAYYSGTSMAAPNVSGALGLLIELNRSLRQGTDLRSATLKGIIIHTADDCDATPGPDYRYGWGLVNIKNAAQFIVETVSNEIMINEQTLASGDSYEVIVNAATGTPLKATLCWTDPAGEPLSARLDPRNPMLVNDLDLRIIRGDEAYYPYALNPEAPEIVGTTGDNIVDNVEQILIQNPISGIYRVQVTHKGTLRNNQQSFSLLISGGLETPAPPPTPTAVNDSYEMYSNTTLIVNAPGVMNNDSFNPAGGFQSVIVAQPAHGTATMDVDGSFSYQPMNDYIGEDVFQYILTDGTTESAAATVSIQISRLNHAPIAVDDYYSTRKNTLLTVSQPGFINNDLDADNDNLTFIVTQQPTHGNLAVNSNGSFTYTPLLNYQGNDYFIYYLYDGIDYSQPAVVHIEVKPPKQKPNAVKDHYSVLRNNTLMVAAVQGVLSNDNDPDDESLSAIMLKKPRKGKIAFNPDGSFMYVPYRNAFGTDCFTYKTVNESGLSVNSVAYINIIKQ